MTRYKEGADTNQFAETQHQLIPQLPPINKMDHGNVMKNLGNQTDGFSNNLFLMEKGNVK